MRTDSVHCALGPGTARAVSQSESTPYNELVTRTMTILAVLSVALPAAASAHAPATLAPPGNSGVSQYLEVVPTDSGSKPTGTSGSSGGGLSAHQQHRLDSLGSAGRTLANVVSTTAPAPIATHSDLKRAKQAGAASQQSTGASAAGSKPVGRGAVRSPVSSLVSAALGSGGGGGLGWFLPVLIAASTLAVVLRAVVQMRRGRAS